MRKCHGQSNQTSGCDVIYLSVRKYSYIINIVNQNRMCCPIIGEIYSLLCCDVTCLQKTLANIFCILQSFNPFVQRCHYIAQLLKSHFLVNAWVLLTQLHISHYSGHKGCIHFSWHFQAEYLNFLSHDCICILF